MEACVIIPARFKSSRFPGKPLAKLNGKEMILWVAELSSSAVGIENVFVATDDLRISEIVNKNGFKSIITKSNLLTGTDRVAEAAMGLNYEIIVNVQGDEPLVNPADILKAIELKKVHHKSVINSYCLLKEDEDPKNKNIPKVVTNENNDLIYISRAVIPSTKEKNIFTKYKKQVCIYSFYKEQLKRFINYGKKGFIENLEDIEILRFFEIGINIKMYEASIASLAVDTPGDIKKVEIALEKRFY